jgi:hypothetical protein
VKKARFIFLFFFKDGTDFIFDDVDFDATIGCLDQRRCDLISDDIIPPDEHGNHNFMFGVFDAMDDCREGFFAIDEESTIQKLIPFLLNEENLRRLLLRCTLIKAH